MKLRLFRRKGEPGVLRGRPEDRWRQLIADLAPGRSFVDVGCMWNVHGGYAFHALASGATRVVGVDVEPATDEFHRRNADQSITFVQGDVNDPRLRESLGTFEVVFCAGVLYHMPNPLWTLERLRDLTGSTLILSTARIAERSDAPQGAVFFPHLTPEERTALQYPSSSGVKVGLDTDYVPDAGYGNWFWGLTPSCIRALLKTAGLPIREELVHRYVYTAVCDVA